MTSRGFVVSLSLAAAIGIGVSLALTPAMAMMVALPVITSMQTSSPRAFLTAFAYYFAASWPLTTAATYFFGAGAPALSMIMLWTAAASLLAAPWGLFWTAKRRKLIWRLPLAIAASAVPPLGIVGWASPLTSAGLLLPGTSWFGLAAVVLGPVWLIRQPRRALPVALVAIAIANSLNFRTPPPPANWEAVDTQFGALSGYGPSSSEFAAAEWIKERALRSDCQVIIFPETVVPMWTAATDLFWQQTLDELRARAKTIVLGAGVPRHPPGFSFVDFSSTLIALNGLSPATRPAPETADTPYWNTISIRGAETGQYLQRIPVPLGMWKPLRNSGVPLNAFGPGVLAIGDQRIAPLLCYETLIVGPVLQSMAAKPTMIVVLANDHWARGSAIPDYQRTVVSVWSRLFHVPCLIATNR